MNCTDLKDGNPCLECEACRLIEEGTPDITEIDAASNNGIDDVRALRDEIVYSPVNCKYRVYIIDEVHMLSSSAFNALLKTVEEPPSHVVFILATTESHKVPATIISRCQRFEFTRISSAESAERLIKIASLENISLDETAAALISRLSDGGMRDAINLLDTCASMDKHVTAETVSECAGVAGKEHLFQISEAVLNKDGAAALTLLGSLHKRSKDMGRLVDELIYHYRNLMLLKMIPNSSEENISDILSVLPQDMADYKLLCGKMTLEHIMRALRILEECFERLGRSRERRLLVEMCFVELCTPKLDSGEKAILSRLEDLERKVTEGSIIPELKTVEKPDIVRDIKPDEKSADKQDIVSGMNPSENFYDDIPPPPDDIPPPAFEKDNYVFYTEPEAPITAKILETDGNRYRSWGDVLNLLPPFLSGILEDVTVNVSEKNGEPVIYGNEIVKGIVSNPENREKILVAIRLVSDGKLQNYKFIEIESSDKNIKEKADPVREFLSLLEAEGVEVKKR